MKNIEQLVRKNILELKPYTSARDKFQDGIFLDANENSFGSVFENNHLNINRYPDPHQKKLRAALSEYLQVNPEKIFFGVGSDEIIDLSIRIFCEPGKSNVIIPVPTYGMYKVACDINDIEIRSVPLDENFDLEISSTLKLVDENTKMIFLCSPNNPTGNLLNDEKIKLLSKNFQGIIFIDEAYIDFAEDKSFIKYLPEFNNVIVSRTFSKAWGMAGARCGYAIATEFIINLFFKVKAPYSINKLTEDAVLSAIKNHQLKDEMVKKILSEKHLLIERISRLNFVKTIYPSDANFILVEINDAQKVYEHLNKKSIRVRMRTDDDRLKSCIRITVGNKSENENLISALKELE